MRSELIAIVVVLALGGCDRPPLYVVSKTADQISVCRETDTAEFQEAENLAAEFCATRGLLPRLAGTARCSRKSVRYNYICVTPRY